MVKKVIMAINIIGEIDEGTSQIAILLIRIINDDIKSSGFPCPRYDVQLITIGSWR